MLKRDDTLSVPEADFIFPDNGNEVRLIRHYVVHDAMGEIMSLIEMCGLQDKQEQSLKDAIKRVVWRKIWNDEFSFVVPRSIEDKIFDLVTPNRVKSTGVVSRRDNKMPEIKEKGL